MEREKYDLDHETVRFRPLVVATAKRYAGRGADFDDLVQEGYLALLQLIPRCPRPELLPLYLKKRLPGRVRTAARREWKRDDLPLDSIEGTTSEPATPPHEPITENLGNILNEKERHLAALLIDGNSQKEAAARLGITQQAVSARIRKIRNKLKPGSGLA